jgi:hypothetical protein
MDVHASVEGQGHTDYTIPGAAGYDFCQEQMPERREKREEMGCKTDCLARRG